ncbi:hypothetical protein D046_3197B, partial [Vibrio parahaemolyticus V-223/04]
EQNLQKIMETLRITALKNRKLRHRTK